MLGARREDLGWAAVGASVVIAANRAGVGWSWDSTDYVETGINLAEGRGLVDVTGRLMTVRPPGLPAVVALGHALGVDPGATLQILNAACAAVVVALAALLLRRGGVGAWPRRWALAMLAASPALLWQYTMAWSEPPFLALEMAALAVALHARRAWRWPVLALLCAAMCVVRYVGPVFAASIIAAGLVAYVRGTRAVQRDRRGSGPDGSALGRRRLGAWSSAVTLHGATLVASTLPLWWWLARNRSIDGTLTGARAPGGGSLLGPLRTAAATLGTWVLGRPFEGGIYMTWADYPASARMAGGAAAVAMAVALGAATIASIRRRTVDPLGLACVLVAAAYVAFSAWRFVHVELGPLDNRMMIPVFVPLVLLAALCADRLARRSRAVRCLVAAVGIALLAPQALTTARDTAAFGRDGRHWGSRAFQDAPIHTAARALPGPAGWYSNEPQQLYAAVRSGPILTQYQKDDGPRQSCASRYVVWYRQTFLPDDEPTALPVLFADEWGTIYDLGPCDENVNLRWP